MITISELHLLRSTFSGWSKAQQSQPRVPDSNKTTPLTLPSSHNADRLPSGPLPLFHTVVHFSPPLLS